MITFYNFKTGETSELSILEFARVHRLTEQHVQKLINGKSVHAWRWNKEHSKLDVQRMREERRAKNHRGNK